MRTPEFLTNLSLNVSEMTAYLTLLITLMLIIIFFLYKTYRASMNVEKRLSTFSSITNSKFGRKLEFIEVNSNEHRINKQALGPLARIIDSYCVITTDQAGTITYANEKFLALSGHTTSDLVGLINTPQESHFQNEKEKEAMTRSLSENKVWHGEIGNKSKKGGMYWMNVFVFPLSYITDIESGYIYFGTDITKMKAHNSTLETKIKQHEAKISRVESMLLNSEKMASLGAISAGIAHEINNPIAFVSANVAKVAEYTQKMAAIITETRNELSEEAFSKILREGANTNSIDHELSDFSELISETNDGISRVQNIIRDLKSFSHEQRDEFSEVDIHHCIDVSLNLALHEVKHKVDIIRSFQCDFTTVLGAEGLLSQVFVNLIVNAAQAIPERGEIRIETHSVDKGVEIRVTDNGAGMAPEVLANIFEPFYTTKPVGLGTGLGLSISHDIIQRHGGTISASSVLGEGTSFIIILPAGHSAHHHAA